MKRIFFGVAIGIAACAAFFATPVLAAQEKKDPLFLMTWKSDNHAPAWYEGKVFPIELSSVRVSFELVGQNKEDYGKLIDLSSSEVRWYIKGNLVQRSTGGQSLIVHNRDYAGNLIEIKVSVQYPDPVSGSKYFVERWIDIPISQPEIVIRPAVSAGLLERNVFEAIPFFFNASNYSLDVQWIVNGTERKFARSTDRFLYAVQEGDAAEDGIALRCVMHNGLMESAGKSYYTALKGSDNQ